MFDSLYDADGREWQTKAFDRNLDEYRIGDVIPADCAASYQVEIYCGFRDDYRESLATIRSGVLVAIDDQRDQRLPLIDWGGHLVRT
jgi:hypothetical protein